MELFKIFGSITIKGVDEVNSKLNNVINIATKMSTKLDRLVSNLSKTDDAMDDLSDTIDDTKVSTDKLTDSTDKLEDEFDDARDSVEDLGDASKKTGNRWKTLGKVFKTVGKGILVATGAAATGAVTLIKKVSDSYGQLQQSIGGVETLFGDSADKVIKNANDAFKTAGISANEYMRQATSFSASLLNSLGGDTVKAADIADMAIRDMADNANKMGTSMEMIQNAYQGFSRQNYVMLDNLKLGYGGTKTEMERLLKDAQKITGIKYNIKNLDDVFEAIHVIQEELGITGTTAKEAGETIEGSFNSLGSAWENFIAGLGNPEADMKQLVDNLAKGIEGALNNITPIIDNMVQSLPIVMDALINAVSDMAPTLISTFTELVTKVLDAIVKLLPTIIPLVVDCLLKVTQALIENLPLIIDAGMQLILGLAQGISEALPQLLPLIVDVVVQIVNTLVNNTPLLVETAVTLVLALVEGITTAIPQLVEQIPNIVSRIVETLVSNLPLFIDCGVKLIKGFITGFSTMAKQFPVIIQSIISGIVDGFVKGVPKMFSSGSKLMGGLGDGLKKGLAPITNFFSDLINKIKNMWSNFTNWIKHKFQIPHLKFSGSINPKDWFKGKMPKIGVEWYADGGIMTKPTMFGVNPSSGNAMVGGESGAEAILPIDKLEGYVKAAVKDEMNGTSYYFEKLIDLLGQYLPDIRDNANKPLVLDTGALVSGTASKMDAELGNRSSRKLRYGV